MSETDIDSVWLGELYCKLTGMTRIAFLLDQQPDWGWSCIIQNTLKGIHFPI